MWAEVTCPVCDKSFETDNPLMVPTHFVLTEATAGSTKPCSGSRRPTVEE